MRLRSCLAVLAASLPATGLAACGSSTDPGAAGSADKTPAGAKATLVAFADAYLSGDGKRACAFFAPDVLQALKASTTSCEAAIAKLKTVLTADDVKRFKASAAAQTPTVSGAKASLPGRGVVLVYEHGRWLVTAASARVPVGG